MTTQPPRIYSRTLEEAAERVLKEASARKLTLATAESCTGGALAALLTDVEGWSHVFERGVAVYCDQAKIECLGVSEALLKMRGAVSAEVAEAMAMGLLQRSTADLAIAITGNAGPAGPDEEEGLVYLCGVRRGGDPCGKTFHFGALGRTGVRVRALEEALVLLESLITDAAADSSRAA